MKIRKKTKLLGRVMNILLPSIKMKSYSARGVLFERELHSFLLTHFTGYTVTSGNITGYWKDQGACEECNEHREYQVAIDQPRKQSVLEKYLEHLAWELNEKTVYLTFDGKARLISAAKNPAPH
ncbi:MAG: hypothetical protein JWM99_683 [Verrucomicrobiales bacterium]|nr:hypothetical protein [Verrucomicrobiales bacterium]